MDFYKIYIISLVTIILIILPISIKWELRLKYIISYCLLLSVALSLLTYYFPIISPLTFVTLIIIQTSLTITFSTILLLWRFYRDPERNTRIDKKYIYAPADGKIVYLREIFNDSIIHFDKKKSSYRLEDFTRSESLKESKIQIGIGMSFLDVHINRAPISGQIKLIKHIEGKFNSLKDVKAILENERQLTIIEGNEIVVAVVQIASRLVRMIVSFVKTGDRIFAGNRIGKIRFGSQVDLIIASKKKLRILVKEDQFVTAGITPLVELLEMKK